MGDDDTTGDGPVDDAGDRWTPSMYERRFGAWSDPPDAAHLPHDGTTTDAPGATAGTHSRTTRGDGGAGGAGGGGGGSRTRGGGVADADGSRGGGGPPESGAADGDRKAVGVSGGTPEVADATGAAGRDGGDGGDDDRDGGDDDRDGGDAPPVVVVMQGAGNPLAAYEPVFADLPEDYDLRFAALPGHEDRRDESLDIDGCVATAAAHLDAPGPVVLVGHSLGGYTAIETARRHGDRVGGVVATGVGTGWGAILGLGAMATLFRPAQWAGVDPLVDAVGADSKIDTGAVVDAFEAEQFDYRAMAAGCRELLGHDRAAPVDYDGPLVVVNGRDDPVGEGVEEIVGQRDHYELRLVDGDHLAAYDQCDALVDAVVDVVERAVAAEA